MENRSFNRHISCLVDCLQILKGNFNQYDNWPQFSVIDDYDIVERITPFLLNFRAKLSTSKRLDLNDARSDLINILGYGKGSTPQSDDFFLGVLSTICSLERDNPNFQRNFLILSNFSYEKFTTAESSTLIRKILMSNYPDEVKNYIELLNDPLDTLVQLTLFNNEIRKIMMIGVSSGKYFLLGSLWEIQLQAETRKE